MAKPKPPPVPSELVAPIGRARAALRQLKTVHELAEARDLPSGIKLAAMRAYYEARDLVEVIEKACAAPETE